MYIETTIPSFYHTTRTGRFASVRRDLTRRWWDGEASQYELVTSEAVLDELAGGNYPSRQAAEALVENLPVLEITDEIADTVQAYFWHRLMPADPRGDAVHLAFASHHRCDFLLTWNCRHLANANKFGHIRRVNDLLGLFVPTLVTPLQLLGESDDEID
ncbi:MAG TPA: type II toxin-antitoxin system VapC family toxin [Longimicrobium sp.]|nr:type II toxin-antitoxin system VapC family toxin [Longimicrobium sp.]